MKKNETKCLGVQANITDDNMENNSIDFQFLCDKDVETISIPLDKVGCDVCKMQKILEEVCKDSVIKKTTNCDNQMIRLESSCYKFRAKSHQDDLNDEKEELERENEVLTAEAEEILFEYGFDSDEFDPECALSDEVQEELPEDALEEIEDISDTININKYRIAEIDGLINTPIRDINFVENFCKYKPEVQSKLDDIIRSASFSALHTYFTAYRGSKGYEEYEYDTKEIMQALSLVFCDIVDGEVDFTNMDECYQALKDMTYELYKAIPGKESKED